jgi:hypothetical protein
VLAASTAVFIGAAAALLTLRSGEPVNDATDRAAPPAPTTPDSAEPGPTPAADRVVLRVEVVPAGADVSLDGERIGAGPLRAERPRDDEEHQLRIEADGYEPDTRTVSLAADVQVLVTLERSTNARVADAQDPAGPANRHGPSSHRSPPATTEPTASPSPPVSDPTGITGRPGQPKKRDLDPSDPWSK